MFPEHQNCAKQRAQTYTRTRLDMQRMLPKPDQVFFEPENARNSRSRFGRASLPEEQLPSPCLSAIPATPPASAPQSQWTNKFLSEFPPLAQTKNRATPARRKYTARERSGK